MKGERNPKLSQLEIFLLTGLVTMADLKLNKMKDNSYMLGIKALGSQRGTQ